MDFFNVIVVDVSLLPTVRLFDLTRTLRPTNFTVLICKKCMMVIWPFHYLSTIITYALYGHQIQPLTAQTERYCRQGDSAVDTAVHV